MHCFRHYFFLATLVTGTALADASHIEAELSLRHDSNVSRAEASDDISSDNILAMDINVSRSFILSPNSGVLLRAETALAEFKHFDDISHVDLGVSALYRIQPIVGYTSPWFDAGISAQRLNFMGSDIRNGNVLALDAGIGQRFTDKLRAHGGITLERRYADDNDVFDWQRLKVSIAADFKYSPAITFYTNLSRTYGDQVFTATPTPAFLNAAKAVMNDSAFGARRAYRLNAVADMLELGSSFSLNPSNTLDVGLRYFQIDAEGSHSYDGTEVRMSWLYRFQ
ncbi:MAG: DUF2860 domain-containing protein [Methylophilales bacterium]|nr:DUF2860 domain-containing protein [Methylophilales bacterium]